MKLIFTGSLVLLAVCACAQTPSSTTKAFEKPRHEFNVWRQFGFLPAEATALNLLENLTTDPAHNWTDWWMANNLYPNLSRLYPQRMSGFGYTYHKGVHGLRLQLGYATRSERGSTSGFGNRGSTADAETNVVGLTSYWGAYGRSYQLKLGYEYNKDVGKNRQLYFAADLGFKRSVANRA